MRIDLSNAEDLLFHDQAAWRNMPDMAHHRDQWAFSKTSPHLRPTGIRAIIDFLQSAGNDQEKALSAYFGTDVTINKFDPSPVRNIEFRMDSPPDLGGMSDYTAFSSCRDGDKIKITFWR